MEPLAIAAAVLQARAAGASSSSAAARRRRGRPSCSPRRAPRSRCWDPEPCAEMEALAADAAGRLRRCCRRASWSAADLRGRRAGRRRRRGRGRGRPHLRRGARAPACPSTSSTSPRFCTFQFGAIVNRSPLVVGISTDGAAPVFGQAIRSRIEALLPAGFARWAAAAQGWRGELGRLGLAPAVRRRFWEALRRRSRLRAPDRAPDARATATTLLRDGARAGRECARCRPRHAGRRRARRSRAADAQGAARAALGRRHPVRRSGGARDPRLRPPRGQAHAGRQDRPPPLLQAGRHQRADGGARARPASAWCGSRPAIP